MFAQSVHSACSPARCILVQAIDHGAVTIHQNRPAVSVLLVCLHADAEQEHHAPVPAVIKGDVKLGMGPLKERGRGDEEDQVHPHLVVVAPERPAIDKLLAKKVLVSNIKAAEDVDLRSFTSSSAASCARSLLHSSEQPPNVTPIELIVFPVGNRKTQATKPVAAIVMQITGQFLPKVF